MLVSKNVNVSAAQGGGGVGVVGFVCAVAVGPVLLDDFEAVHECGHIAHGQQLGHYGQPGPINAALAVVQQVPAADGLGVQRVGWRLLVFALKLDARVIEQGV